MRQARQSWVFTGGLLSAIAASLCCLGPLAAVTLGLGGFAAAHWFAAWRPVFIGLSLVLLAAAWFLAIRARRSACADGAACASAPKRWPLVVLGIASVFAVAVMAFPNTAQWVASQPPAASNGSADASVLQVRIPTMDCAACAIGIERMLCNVPGVTSASVHYATKLADVSYDPARISPPALIARIDATGFKAEPIR